jgi:hypothetical protein
LQDYSKISIITYGLEAHLEGEKLPPVDGRKKLETLVMRGGETNYGAALSLALDVA